MQIILVKYIQLFCFTFFLSNNIKCDQLLLRNDNEDRQIYEISSCTGRCIKYNGNLTLEQCYEDCVEYPSDSIKYQRKIYRNLEVRFVCRDDTSFVIEIIPKEFENENNSSEIIHDENDNDDRDDSWDKVPEKNDYRNGNGINASGVRSIYPDMKQVNRNNTISDSEIYVLKVHQEDKFPIEKQIYLTNSSLIRIDNLQPNTKYHLSAAVVYPSNEYSLIAKGLTYRTLKKIYKPKEITKVTVDYIRDQENRKYLSAKIIWEPAIDQTCFYDILLYSPQKMEFDLSPIEIRNPKELFSHTIRNLTFDTQYQIAVRGKNIKELSKESDLIWNSIETPSCYDWYQNNSKICREFCAPLKPEDLTAVEKLILDNKYSMNVSWKKPFIPPDYYTFKLFDLHRVEAANSIIMNISKDATSVFLPKINLNGFDYEIHLTAFSGGGDATSTLVNSISNYIRLSENYRQTKLTIAIVIPIISLGVAFLVIIIICSCRIKLNRLKERCTYIEDGKKNPIEPNSRNFGIKSPSKFQIYNSSGKEVFLDIEKLQLDLEHKLYINDEKEIDAKNVKLLEILGEGAFGLVRRGILNVNKTKSIEVAVKMLKDHPACEDIKAFRREIDVMKSVGDHPNIVGLIGHCTKSIEEMMLLTEYCSLGNLQNFLRNEWKQLNRIIFLKDKTSPKTPNNSKHSEHIFNYNNSLTDKQPIQYKHLLLCNENNSTELKFILMAESQKNNSVDASTTPSTVEPPLIKNRERTDAENGQSSTDMVVINKGYELSGPCTNSCKCKVDIILKKNEKIDEEGEPKFQHLFNKVEFTDHDEVKCESKDDVEDVKKDLVCEIDIQNCDCGDAMKKLELKNPSYDIKPVLIENENYYRQLEKDNPKKKVIYEELLPKKHVPLKSFDLLQIAKQIAMGMEFLSKNKVVHRDLAARNVLVCEDHTIKIADFGLSRDVYQENIYKKIGNGKLPIKWLALESMTHQIYTSQSDVWSYGVLLYEIITLGSTPYPSVPNNRLLELLKSGYRMEKPKPCSAELYDLMTSCWITNPGERPTFTNIVATLNKFLMGNPDEHIDTSLFCELIDKREKIETDESYLKPIEKYE